MRKKNNKKQFGFTLVELLVSIVIIITITGIFLVNYYSANDKQVLYMAAQQVVSDIRLAQSHALGLKEFEGSVPGGGWGVSFSLGSSYIIFADVNDNKLYNIGEEFSSISLPENINIYTLLATPTDIVFTPPDPETYFNNGTGEYAGKTKAFIALIDQDNQKTKVRVNLLGLIEVVDYDDYN